MAAPKQQILVPMLALLVVAALSVLLGARLSQRALDPALVAEGFQDAQQLVEALCGSRMAFVTPGSLLTVRRRAQLSDVAIDASPETMRLNEATSDETSTPLSLVEENGLYYKLLRSTFLLPRVQKAEIAGGRLTLHVPVRDTATQAIMMRFLLTRPMFVELSIGKGQATLHVLANTRDSVMVRERGAITFVLSLPFLNTGASKSVAAKSYVSAPRVTITSFFADHRLGEVQQALGRSMRGPWKLEAGKRQLIYDPEYAVRYKDQLAKPYQFMVQFTGSVKRLAFARFRSCDQNSFGALFDRSKRSRASCPPIVMEGNPAWLAQVADVHLGRLNLLHVHDAAKLA
jgi:hypothetical protein